jgi:glycosyltransferase involved in cell wall biosynthesis
MSTKINVAFIKYAGMSVGGSELWLQKIAAYLPKEKYSIDYFYCDASPYIGSDYAHISTNQGRIDFVEKHGVNLVKFNVGAKDIRHPDHRWVNTDFWEKFDEKKYDLIQTVKAGPREYPYYLIDKPVVEIVALANRADKTSNIAWSFHSSPWQRTEWLKKGGSTERSSALPAPLDSPLTDKNYRNELGIPAGAVVAGFHQRVDDAIFSPIPLDAFARHQNNLQDSTQNPQPHFVIKGGSQLYRKQAEQLNLRNVHFLPPTGDSESVSIFLNTLDFMAHGRKDGETFGAVLAEAMLHGKACLSHYSPEGSNAHVETIGPGGFVAKDLEEYTEKLSLLYSDKKLRDELSEKARAFAEARYSIKSCVEEVVKVYDEVLSDPSRFTLKTTFPEKISRIVYDHLYFILRTIRATLKKS